MKTVVYPGMSPRGAKLTELMLEAFRLNGALLQAGDRLVADIGITSARWQVLGAIALGGVQQPVAHVARDMGLARQSVQRIVNELAAEGLVRLVANPHHRRARLVELTSAGQAVYDAAIDRHVPWANLLAGAMKTSEIVTATATMRTLRRRLEGGVGLPVGADRSPRRTQPARGGKS